MVIFFLWYISRNEYLLPCVVLLPIFYPVSSVLLLFIYTVFFSCWHFRRAFLNGLQGTQKKEEQGRFRIYLSPRLHPFWVDKITKYKSHLKQRTSLLPSTGLSACLTACVCLLVLVGPKFQHWLENTCCSFLFLPLSDFCLVCKSSVNNQLCISIKCRKVFKKKKRF